MTKARLGLKVKVIDQCCRSDLDPQSTAVFTRATLCYSAVLAVIVCPSVCLSLSVRLSLSLRYCTKVAKPRITRTTLYDNPGTRFLTPTVDYCQVYIFTVT